MGFFGVSVESGTSASLLLSYANYAVGLEIFLSSYGGEVGKFFVLVSFSTGGY